MSVELTLVRSVNHLNVDEADWGAPVRVYIFIEIITHGWSTGSRWRTRRFSTLPSVYKYLNKMLAGRWMDTASYDAAWTKVLRLQDELFSRRHVLNQLGDTYQLFGDTFDVP